MSQAFDIATITETQLLEIIDAQKRGEEALKSVLLEMEWGASVGLDEDALPLHNLLSNDGERIDELGFIAQMGTSLADEGPSGWRCIEHPEVVAIARLLGEVELASVGRRARARGLDPHAMKTHVKRLRELIREAAANGGHLMISWNF